MKKLFLLLALFFTGLSYAQQPEGMVLINNFEIQKEDSTPILINHRYIAEALDEFVASAEFYPIAYKATLSQIESIQFIDAPEGFQYSVEGNTITINGEYARYEYLTRLITWQALGVKYGLPVLEEGRYIMSKDWQPGPQYESWAIAHALQRNAQKHQFFKTLEEHRPLEIYYKF